ncbi:DsrE family protein [Thiohalophilus thiocyanatoxydans]|uniref:Uncharacterized protein n=1 Tax=Thiohalophilus thiocyanatoxydans TaxID=381308 RepID=A0A4R8IXE8_9GAMM|nr:DsrE family protein [Thiohalophilus thiocyanatoxydans]TDY02557.1 hypothetical protein EDC23_0932 [Thiohalophilus thiocyanatoxydans]
MNRMLLLIVMLLTSLIATADERAPWGTSEAVKQDYQPQKVVYDVAVSSRKELEQVFDRASYLSQVYEADPFSASIVLVLHGDEIPFFAVKNYLKYKELVTRARSLTVGDVIDIRMCQIAARGHGYAPEDIHGFVQMVPMADAEIIRLQREENYAYMQ